MKETQWAGSELVKHFRIFRCDVNYQPREYEAEYDNIEEVRAHRYRLDRYYQIRTNGNLYSIREFNVMLLTYCHRSGISPVS